MTGSFFRYTLIKINLQGEIFLFADETVVVSSGCTWDEMPRCSFLFLKYVSFKKTYHEIVSTWSGIIIYLKHKTKLTRFWYFSIWFSIQFGPFRYLRFFISWCNLKHFITGSNRFAHDCDSGLRDKSENVNVLLKKVDGSNHLWIWRLDAEGSADIFDLITEALLVELMNFVCINNNKLGKMIQHLMIQHLSILFMFIIIYYWFCSLFY